MRDFLKRIAKAAWFFTIGGAVRFVDHVVNGNFDIVDRRWFTRSLTILGFIGLSVWWPAAALFISILRVLLVVGTLEILADILQHTANSYTSAA